MTDKILEEVVEYINKNNKYNELKQWEINRLELAIQKTLASVKKKIDEIGWLNEGNLQERPTTVATCKKCKKLGQDVNIELICFGCWKLLKKISKLKGTEKGVAVVKIEEAQEKSVNTTDKTSTAHSPSEMPLDKEDKEQAMKYLTGGKKDAEAPSKENKAWWELTCRIKGCGKKHYKKSHYCEEHLTDHRKGYGDSFMEREFTYEKEMPETCECGHLNLRHHKKDGSGFCMEFIGEVNCDCPQFKKKELNK